MISAEAQFQRFKVKLNLNLRKGGSRERVASISVIKRPNLGSNLIPWFPVCHRAGFRPSGRESDRSDGLTSNLSPRSLAPPTDETRWMPSQHDVSTCDSRFPERIRIRDSEPQFAPSLPFRRWFLIQPDVSCQLNDQFRHLIESSRSLLLASLRSI